MKCTHISNVILFGNFYTAGTNIRVHCIRDTSHTKMVTEDAYIIPLLESSSMCQNRIKLFILFVVSYRFLIYELLI